MKTMYYYLMSFLYWIYKSDMTKADKKNAIAEVHHLWTATIKGIKFPSKPNQVSILINELKQRRRMEDEQIKNLKHEHVVDIYPKMVLGEENWEVTTTCIDGWDTPYSKLAYQPSKDEFMVWAYLKYPVWAKTTYIGVENMLSTAINKCEWLWSKFVEECRQSEDGKEKVSDADKRIRSQSHTMYKSTMATNKVVVDLINKKKCIRDINMVALGLVLCQLTLDNLRICLYDNHTYFGCSVQKTKNLGISKMAYRILKVMFDEYLKNVDNPKSMYEVLSSAPTYSIAGRIWEEITIDPKPIIKDEIPKEDREFWLSIFGSTETSFIYNANIAPAFETREDLQSHLMQMSKINVYANIHAKWDNFNERTIDREFAVIEDNNNIPQAMDDITDNLSSEDMQALREEILETPEHLRVMKFGNLVSVL